MSNAQRMSIIEDDRRNAINTYFRLLQTHSDFIERTQDTFNTIESHLDQLILQYNDEIEELPMINRNRHSSNNRNSTRSRNNQNLFNMPRNGSTTATNTSGIGSSGIGSSGIGSSGFGTTTNLSGTNVSGTTTRNPFASTSLFNDLRTSRRRTPAFTPSQNILDTITLWALFPNGIGTNNNLENLSPVVVRPTDAQIREATENMNFRDVIDPVNRTCPISQDEFQDDDDVTVIRHCGHIFRQEDFQTWFRSNVRCPLCRYDIREYRRGGGGALSRQNSMRRENSPISGSSTQVNIPIDSNSDINTNSDTNSNSSNNQEPLLRDVSNNPLTNNINNQYYVNPSANNWLNLINENMSRVIQSSDISDNINVNFEYSYIIPPISTNDNDDDVINDNSNNII